MQATVEQLPTTRLLGANSHNAPIDPQYYNQRVDPEFVGCRQRLLSTLMGLSNSLDQQQWDISETLLHQFCKHLTNYLTIGHERAFAQENLDPDLCAAIAGTTRTAMYFTDRYCRGTGRLDQVRPALEQLALALETRFELEDDLQALSLVA